MASGVPGSVHAAISTKVRAQLHYSLLHYLLQLQLGKVVPICDGFYKEHNRSSRACHAAKDYLAVGHHCCSNHSAEHRSSVKYGQDNDIHPTDMHICCSSPRCAPTPFTHSRQQLSTPAAAME
ncbi:hypothetical protein OEZ85_011663 [Tetradesmus obliquus]|uniref:Uncharacterized protein n=1 Tax=Tetradesmus obliquus TaxID=3088 RepID=A0ABY8TRS0_TETOB|nr:hypothetical protein OEZ85_011663 [Tetradesmus obliquus]